MAGLEAGGLTSAAVFRHAVRQLGDRVAVARKFAKINPHRLWLERMLWVAVGVLALQLAGVLDGIAAPILGDVLIWLDCALIVEVWISGLVSLFISAGGVFLCWRYLQREPVWLSKLARTGARHPWLTCGLLAVGLQQSGRLFGVVRDLLPRLPESLVQARAQDYEQLLPSLTRLMNLTSALEHMLWAGAFCLLAAWLWRTREGRRHPGDQAGLESATRRLWLERGFWMVAGAVMFRYLVFGWSGLVGWSALGVSAIWSETGMSTVREHLLGGLALTLYAALPIGLILMSRPTGACPAGRLEGVLRAVGRLPVVAGVVLALLLSVNEFFVLSGALDSFAANVQPGAILVSWFRAAMVLPGLLAPALLLTVLLLKRTVLECSPE